MTLRLYSSEHFSATLVLKFYSISCEKQGFQILFDVSLEDEFCSKLQNQTCTWILKLGFANPQNFFMYPIHLKLGYLIDFFTDSNFEI